MSGKKIVKDSLITKCSLITFGLFFFVIISGQETKSNSSYEEALYGVEMAQNLEEALTFTKYPTYEQYDSMMHHFASTYPDICHMDTIGYSINNRLILALKISDNPELEEDEPKFMYSATMHGDELVGYILTLRLINFILENYGHNIEIDRIVDNVEIYINPLSNPDGTYSSGNNNVAGAIRYNSEYKDLNRNFPDLNLDAIDDTTGLPQENKCMMMYLRKHRFNLSANLHSGEEVVNYPWDYQEELHPDDDWWIHVSREYADLARDVNPSYMSRFPDGITNGWDWYDVNDGRQDYVNFFLKGRELTLELSMTKILSSSSLENFWTYNKWSLINYITQATYGIHGHVINAENGKAIPAKIVVLDHDQSFARIKNLSGIYKWLNTETLDQSEYIDAPQTGSYVLSDTMQGDFYRYLKEGSYDLEVSADGYLTDTLYNIEIVDFHKTELTIELDSLVSNTDRSIQEKPYALYPNPIREYLVIETQAHLHDKAHIKIYNSTGQLLKTATFSTEENHNMINFSAYNEGVYFLTITSGNKFWIEKLIKLN